MKQGPTVGSRIVESATAEGGEWSMPVQTTLPKCPLLQWVCLDGGTMACKKASPRLPACCLPCNRRITIVRPLVVEPRIVSRYTAAAAIFLYSSHASTACSASEMHDSTLSFMVTTMSR